VKPPAVDRQLLEDQRTFLLVSIEDLDAEHEAGDIDLDDYLALRADYTARAASVLRQLRDLDGPGENPATSQDGTGEEAQPATPNAAPSSRVSAASLSGVAAAAGPGSEDEGSPVSGPVQPGSRRRSPRPVAARISGLRNGIFPWADPMPSAPLADAGGLPTEADVEDTGSGTRSRGSVIGAQITGTLSLAADAEAGTHVAGAKRRSTATDDGVDAPTDRSAGDAGPRGAGPGGAAGVAGPGGAEPDAAGDAEPVLDLRDTPHAEPASQAGADPDEEPSDDPGLIAGGESGTSPGVFAAAGSDAARGGGRRWLRRRRMIGGGVGVLIVAAIIGTAAASSGSRLPSGVATGAAVGTERQAQLLDDAQRASQQGNNVKALEDYEAVLRTNPNDVDALTDEGWILARTQEPQLLSQGISLLGRAEHDDPTYPPAHVYRGVAYLSEDDYADAVPELTWYLAHDPDPDLVTGVRTALASAQKALASQGRHTPTAASASASDPASASASASAAATKG
jgi:hypothetical protein